MKVHGIQEDRVHLCSSGSRGANETHRKCKRMIEKSLNQDQIPKDTSKSSAHAAINSQMAAYPRETLLGKEMERERGGEQGHLHMTLPFPVKEEKEMQIKRGLHGPSTG